MSTDYVLIDRQVCSEILDERINQRHLWGVQTHPDMIETGGLNLVFGSSARLNCERAFEKGNGSWAHILHEEFGEAIDEARAGNVDALREELIQVAAVCVSWIEDLDRRQT